MKLLNYLTIVILAITFLSCDKDDLEITTTRITISQNLKDNFIFNENSYWIYQDSLSNIDSVSIVSLETGITPSCVIDDCDELEFVTLNYKNHTQDSTYNHYYVLNQIKYNGGGNAGEEGQPIFTLNTDSINGLIVRERFDSLEVLSNTYFDVRKMTVITALQVQPEFTFDTDLYFVPRIGIVKLVIHDPINGVKTWNLKRFNLQ